MVMLDLSRTGHVISMTLALHLRMIELTQSFEASN